MRSHGERHLVLLVVAVSLGLTGLTVWAVARQGRALQAREWADLRNSALAAAAEREATFRADAERAFDSAARAWELGGREELDAWTVSRRDWFLACSSTGPDPWMVYPRTPLEEPLPELRTEQEESPATGSGDLLTMLRDFQRLASNPDPLTRAGALLAMAACEQQLGHPLAAARIFADAAQLLRSTPHLARFAFRAELSRTESLLAAGDRERARQAFTAFVNGLTMDHPARLGPRELTRLGQLEDALGLKPDEPGAAALAELGRRAEQRQSFAAAAQHVLQGPRTPTGSSSRAEVKNALTASNEALVIAIRPIAEDTTLALVSPATDLLGRYWTPADNVAWQVRPASPGEVQDVITRLGPAFSGAIIEPTATTAAHLRATARRHLSIVLATAAGTVGAWVLVIVMMIRAMARQRELARLQGRFVADVSHELKTPLALIRLLSETLADRRVRDPERVHAYHETITRESERLTMLLDNILDLGRIESGRKAYEFTECDVAAVARQAWTLFEQQFTGEGFDARLEIAADVPSIRADAAALQQVLVNLLQNAHRYGGEGKFVRLGVAREGYVVLLTVEDHGIGMTRTQLGRLGESFFRADDTRVRQMRGVGLGLAIAHHIVSAHGGKIEVQSRPGQGSKFTVWIPFEPDEKT